MSEREERVEESGDMPTAWVPDMSGEDWEVEEGVTCVVCPSCALAFDAIHEDEPDGGYSCPNCQVTRTHLDKKTLLAEIGRLREERERLREALHDILEMAYSPQSYRIYASLPPEEPVLAENVVGDIYTCAHNTLTDSDDTAP